MNFINNLLAIKYDVYIILIYIGNFVQILERLNNYDVFFKHLLR